MFRQSLNFCYHLQIFLPITLQSWQPQKLPFTEKLSFHVTNAYKSLFMTDCSSMSRALFNDGKVQKAEKLVKLYIRLDFILLTYTERRISKQRC